MGPIDDARARLRLFQAEELERAGLIPRGGLYYPTIYYPPVPMHGPCSEAAVLDGLEYDGSRAAAVYLHIPFCRTRCLYCHWVVHTDTPREEVDRYIGSLAAEMDLWKEKFRVAAVRPTSVLIGGGTPTALSPEQIRRLLSIVRDRLDLGRCAQVTCETEPSTLLGEEGAERLLALKEGGVGRISLGVQAFDDRSLRDMGRHHSAPDAERAIGKVREAGFGSLAVDLIYGYPGSTPESWLATLGKALSLGVDAFQLYRLRIVPHGDRAGAIRARFAEAPEAFPPVGDIYVMKALGALAAEGAGFRESSRRLFARGEEHASRYLVDHTDLLSDVIGFGISSWSNVQGRFYLNTGESLGAYAAPLARGVLPIDRGGVRTEDDERRWAVAVTLKHNGVPKERFRALTGTEPAEAFPSQVGALARHGLVRDDGERLRLTERGVFFADEVVTQFYHPRYLPFPRSAYAPGDLDPYSHGAS